MQLAIWQWALACAGAFLVGFSKTGIAGLGVLSVALFTLILPVRESVGVVLVVLICGDMIAVTVYRREANWAYLWRLFPWTAVGIGLGYLAVGQINDQQIKQLIGIILLVIVSIHLLRQRNSGLFVEVQNLPWVAPVVGILAGFTTMVANAAGPIMIMYLLTMGLDKMAFIGTAAWFFLIVNLFKVPFSYALGQIYAASLRIDLVLAPFAIGGAVFGRAIIPHINQRLFEALALLLTVVAAVRLLL